MGEHQEGDEVVAAAIDRPAENRRQKNAMTKARDRKSSAKPCKNPK